MKPDRTLLNCFLVYAVLVIGWLLGHFGLSYLLHSETTDFTLYNALNITLFALVSALYWFVIADCTNKQKAKKERAAQIRIDRLKLALDAAHEALWDWNLNDSDSVFFSEAYCANLGYSQEEFGNSQQAWQTHLFPEERQRVSKNVMRFMSEGDGHYDSTYRMLHKDQSYRWIRSRGRLIKDSQGKPVRFIGIAQDITEQRGMEERLKQAHAVFESTHEGVLITDHTNTIVHINPAFSQITGYSAEDVMGQTPRMFQSGRHSAEFYKTLWICLESSDQWSGEIWNRRKNGEILPQYQTIRLIRDENGFISHNVAVFSDISILKDSESEINYLSHYDALTGLANRTHLYERLKTTILASIERKKDSAIFLIDLDHFKHINESLGHSLGDQLLQAVAQRFNHISNKNKYTLARVGGDEFVVICEHISTPTKAAAIAQTMIQATKDPFTLDGRNLFISASIGICLFPRSGNSVEEVMRNAGSALTKAKASGRDTFAFYSSELTEQAFQRLRVASELRQALETGGLLLYYQPVYAVDTLQLIGCEALVRWNHPERGLVPPNDFIPIAEENGLISLVDEWVLRQACEQMHIWQEHDQAIQMNFIAVNLSSRSLSNKMLAKTVEKTLKDTHIAPQFLELEVTESAVLEEPDNADSMLKQLRQLGVRLSIDDFGTGYSSLSRLKTLPVHKLKIDQSFISNLPSNVEDAAIVRAILALGKSIGLEVQAEGIETAEQMLFLQELDCPLGQGYWFGRPMPAEDFSKLLTDNKNSFQLL
ncbi:MAG: EAL domain-containing protein [Pseudomonas sp.]|nr:EAL domain-containing protein [Pseudomonas sp.]